MTKRQSKVEIVQTFSTHQARSDLLLSAVEAPILSGQSKAVIVTRALEGF